VASKFEYLNKKKRSFDLGTTCENIAAVSPSYLSGEAFSRMKNIKSKGKRGRTAGALDKRSASHQH
jgi:hypothetical protein